jgi:hypothetical protein
MLDGSETRAGGQPRGFHLAARVLDFPRGMPGDIGLFLM